MAEDVTIKILTLFEELDLQQKQDLAKLLDIIYGPGPHYEAVLRRIKALICTARIDTEIIDINWQAVCDAVCDYVDVELNRGKTKEYIDEKNLFPQYTPISNNAEIV